MKAKFFFILTLSVFFMGTFSLQAALIVTSGISESDFDNAFNNDRVWYGQLQPGGTGDSHPKNEFELGGKTLRYYEGNTSIIDESNNPFEINVDTENNLSVTFNGVGTPEGYQYPVTEKFNTIWIGLESDFSYGLSETLDVINHQADVGNVGVLSDMQVTSTQTEPNWIGFKFYADDKLDNIGNINISGDILPDMRYGGSFDEEWTYTVFATHDPTIPEPSSFVFILGTLATTLVFFRRKLN